MKRVLAAAIPELVTTEDGAAIPELVTPGDGTFGVRPGDGAPGVTLGHDAAYPIEKPKAELDALMARLAEGDRSAFTSVFRSLWGPVSRLCSKILNNEADADDAAQQAMEKILARASDYDPSRPALPWALGIAAWECRTTLRKRGRRREVPADAAEDVACDRVTEEEVEAHELSQAALAAMRELSPVDQQALLSTFWDEASPVRGATLRKRRERALGRLRAALRRLYGLG